VFTNFWDANILAQDKYMTYCFHESPTEKKFYMAWLRNYQVYSIALGMPDASKTPFLKDIFRLDHFCPTYDLLMAYKKDGDWDKYRQVYRKLLVSRKDAIDDWIKALEQDKIYILCCWEDTSKKCNCHRKLLFDALKSTSIWKDKAIWVYRHGNGKYFRMYPSKIVSSDQEDQNIDMVYDGVDGISIGGVATANSSFKLLQISVVKDPMPGMELKSGEDIIFPGMDTLETSSYTTSDPYSKFIKKPKEP
jgi:hypothetical protein